MLIVKEMEREQSEFNMAVSYLARLNTLFYAADEAAIGLDVYTWFHSLKALYRELSTEMSEEEIKDFKAMFSKIAEPLNKGLARNAKTGANTVSGSIYDELNDIEIKLRKVLKGAGLQQKMVDDARSALK